MSCFTVVLDPTVEAFYRRIAAQAGLTLETVLSDTLFKLAGELALEAISRKRAQLPKKHRISPGNRQKRHCFLPQTLLYSIQNTSHQNHTKGYPVPAMKSLRDLYKIGKGPSSSHTIGPERAARKFLEHAPEADRFTVILYGSLSKTGVGHGTDRVLKETLGPDRTEIVFSAEDPADLPHPNTMDFIAYKGETELLRMRVMSVGGGDIVIEGRPSLEMENVYPENSFAEIAEFCRWRNVSLSEYVELNEGPENWDFLHMV